MSFLDGTRWHFGIVVGKLRDGSLSISTLISEAKECDAAALIELGKMYLYGARLSADEANATECFRRAADFGNIVAVGLFGRQQLLGRGTQKNIHDGLTRLATAARAGDLPSAYVIGNFFLKCNDERGWKYLMQAGSGGHIAAQRNIARRLAKLGELDLARFWFLRLVKSGDPKAADDADRFGIREEETMPESSTVTNLIRKADFGDVDALIEVGLLSLDGTLLPKNEGKAVACFSRAAEAGSMAAIGLLGRQQILGHGIEKDLTLGLARLRSAADSGDLASEYALARLLLDSDFVAADSEAGWTLLVKAAESGYTDAQRGLASRLAKRGEHELAQFWYKLAVESGSPEAAYDAGLFYLNFKVGKDWRAEVQRLLSEAANHGYMPAALELGNLYKNNEIDSVEPDKLRQEERRWYRVAADAGSIEAQLELGIHYRPHDEEEVREGRWNLRRAAVANDSRAQLLFAKTLDHAGAVDEAIAYFEGASRQGNPEAAFILAERSELFSIEDREDIEGNDNNPARLELNVTEYYQIAAEGGHTEGQARLGKMYLTGDRVEKDPKEAAIWLSAAGKKGHRDALRQLAEMYERGEGVEIDHNLAIRNALFAVAEGDFATRKWLTCQGLTVETLKTLFPDDHTQRRAHGEYVVEAFSFERAKSPIAAASELRSRVFDGRALLFLRSENQCWLAGEVTPESIAAMHLAWSNDRPRDEADYHTHIREIVDDAVDEHDAVKEFLAGLDYSWEAGAPVTVRRDPHDYSTAQWPYPEDEVDIYLDDEVTRHFRSLPKWERGECS